MPKIPRKSKEGIKPFWQTTDKRTVRLYQGDVVDVLKRLPDKFVQTVVTSPPYWGLRDYGVGGQIGSEKTPDEFVAKMVEVFREIRRVLRDDGTVWLNLGDTYTGGGGYYPDAPSNRNNSLQAGGNQKGERNVKGNKYRGIPSGNLVGIPWRVALALQEDGWILRQDIIWHKPAPMPESVRNRCTKAHEYIFLLVKRRDYFYDQEAIKEPAKHLYNVEGWDKRKDAGATGGCLIKGGNQQHGDGVSHDLGGRDGKSNKRSVWTIASEPYEGAHFATFPTKLIEPCILAGTSEKGACIECGAPWARKLSRDRRPTRPGVDSKVRRKHQSGEYREGEKLNSSTLGSVIGNRDMYRHVTSTETIGWEPTCSCGVEETRPCVVLDPFMGSGTTAIVSIRNGRHSVGIDLNESYLKEQAIPRIEGELLSRPAMAYLTGRKPKRVRLGKKL